MRPVAREPVPHSLTSSELSELAKGKVTVAMVRKLVAAESSKHRLFVEAVRRRVAHTQPSDVCTLVEKAIDLLTEVESHSPHVVTNLLALPQLGGWAVNCLRRMAGEKGGEHVGTVSQSPLKSDLGYLASIAAVAALHASHPFEILIPLRNGRLLLPSLGIANFDSAEPWGLVRVRLDAGRVLVILTDGEVSLPVDVHLKSDGSGVQWSAIPRIHAKTNGLVFDVAFDVNDPFLAYLGRPSTHPSSADLVAWQTLLDMAWRILVRHYPIVAEAVAAGVSVLVPLAGPATSFPRSITSGWTFGAIGLSLPRDALSLAEIFVHEFQHLVLSAVEDLDTLVVPRHDVPLGYAPWRDDPRPPAGLLHGCYAYLGLVGFWRCLRHIGESHERLRSEVEFARWRLVTLETVTTLVNSPALTDIGRQFATGMCDQLTLWQDDAVTKEAELLAAEMCTEHRTRWRLTYLHPPIASVQALARDWLSKAFGERAAIGRVVVMEPGPAALGQTRAYLMELRYRDPERIRWLIKPSGTSTSSRMGFPLDEADIALLRGDYDSASRGYIERLKAANDRDAWIGLAIVSQRAGISASAQLLSKEPELVAAVHAYLRALRGEVPDMNQFIDWLTGRLAASGGDE